MATVAIETAATLRAIYTGGQQLILSPPRHGKTELLRHFCIWLILRNPNIRIMWVAKSDGLARLTIGAIKDHFETNEKLIEAFLGEEGAFKKKGSWSALEFTVSTRTVIGRASYTMVGLGWTGTILSRDCDFIVLDDIEDDRTVGTPGARASTRSKFVVTLDSRVEAHTALLVIGSRQHHDDLYGHLIDNSQWPAIVEQAHSDLCDKNRHQLDSHFDCMLWPEKHPYTWWYSKMISQTEMGEAASFEMVYQNQPRAAGLMVFSRDALLASRNFHRPIGNLDWFTTRQKLEEDDDDHIGTFQMVAGLDPAAVGHQAAWLWLWDFHRPPSGRRLYMLDARNPQGGGIAQFRELLVEWFAEYELTHWFVETNNLQRAFLEDRGVMDFCGDHGITLEPHSTGANKNVAMYGVGAMNQLYLDGLVDLPYGDDRSQLITDSFTKQAINFGTDETTGRERARRTSDLLMASWFPQPAVRGWREQHSKKVHMTYDETYPDYDIDASTEIPWEI